MQTNYEIGAPPVLNGTTGKIIEVDGEPAALVDTPQPALHEVDIADLVRSLVVADEEIEDLAGAVRRLKEAHKKAVARREAVIAEIKGRNEGALPLPFAAASDVEEQEDDEDPL